MSLQQTDLDLEVLRPGDEGYDDAARAFFADGRPALVARPRTPEEVAAALAHAVAQGLAVSVRSGGHSPIGASTNVGGLVLDLAHLAAVEVLDPDRRLVRVGAGAQWGAVSAALDPLGWALTAGDSTTVGVGGLTLGGGIGWLVRRHGLAIDNLVAARMVSADGRLVTASAEENPELFWALRGGGGNFGVVVDLDFVAQPVATVHFGSVTYELDDPAAILTRWRDAMRGAPDELSSTLAFLPPMGGPAAAVVLLCYAGEPTTPSTVVDAAIEPLFELGTERTATIRETRYAAILEQPVHPPGLRMVARNTLVDTVDDDVVAAIAGLVAAPGPRAVSLRSLGGAVARVPADATAFAHRAAEAMVFCGWMLPATAGDADVEAALLPWHPVAALGSGTYVNFQGSATEADLAAAYPPATYARLAAVKREWDPHNVFCRTHNVRPSRRPAPSTSSQEQRA